MIGDMLLHVLLHMKGMIRWQILARAASVAEALDTGDPVELLGAIECRGDGEVSNDTAEEVVRRFMALDIDTDDVIAFIAALFENE